MSEEYDDVVENIYLTAMNDPGCIEQLEQGIIKEKAHGRPLSPSQRNWVLRRTFREAGVNENVVSERQTYKAWNRIKDDLLDKIREREDCYKPCVENPCSDIFLKPVKFKTVSLDELRVLHNEIEQHMTDANASFVEADRKLNEAKQQTLEINIMSELQNTPFKTINYVYGNDIEKMSAEALIEAIKRAKGDISKLKEVGVESKHIKKKIGELDAAIESMVERLDAQEEK